MRINALDDLQIRDSPSSAIGDVLRDDREAAAFAPLNDALEGLFEKYGTELSDKEYLSLAEWIPVVAAAKSLLGVLLEE